ncbi:MAG TPA: DUF2071 domain-containing protein [Gemmatimonadaceae bacterium]|nr:DUF2071 domain-containing protein [Gemmatimonadaceae bacterium]
MTRALSMRWTNLAFLHWRVDPERVQRLLPAGLQLDLFGGEAWVGVVPFRMSRVRPLMALAVPTASDFPELNVRTYVRHGDRSGVWFFSLDAGSRLAVIGARTAVGLPYFHARMIEREVGGDVAYESKRIHWGAASAEFQARYRPTGEVRLADAGSLDHWLTERYSLFAMRRGVLLRLDIEHEHWPLQPATADVTVNSMAQASGIDLPAEAPRVLFAERLDVVARLPRRVNTAKPANEPPLPHASLR